MAALELHQYRAMFYRLTLDSIEWNEERHPRDKRGKFQKRDAITSPDVAADAMRRAILTQQDVRHAVYRADIGYVDFIWGTEGGPPSAAGKRKGAMGIAHILDARVRKDGLTPRQAERVAEQVARVVATGKVNNPRLQSRVIYGQILATAIRREGGKFPGSGHGTTARMGHGYDYRK